MIRVRADWDAVVVGAGPAGSAAALALARGGASVLLVERSSFPRWKVCGACLSPGALSSLSALGARDVAENASAVPLDGMTLHHGGREARLRLRGWAALSRAALDMALVREAQRAGASFRSAARARLGMTDADARVVRLTTPGEEAEVRARVVIDATGLGRGLAEDGQRTTDAAPGARVGIGVQLDAPDYPIDSGELHMVVGRSGYVGLVRVEDGSLNVAAAVDAPQLRSAEPARLVAGILREAGLPPLPAAGVDRWRGTPRLDRSGDHFGAHRLLRLGDAAGYVEPFTGEGIGWALDDGRVAADIAQRIVDGATDGALAAWTRYRTRRRSAERICRVVASGLRRPWMVSAAFSAIRASPRIAEPWVRRVGRSRVDLAPARP
jgi:flavin-dependent dehydrogenase